MLAVQASKGCVGEGLIEIAILELHPTSKGA